MKPTNFPPMSDQPTPSTPPAPPAWRPLPELIHEFALHDLVWGKITPILSTSVANAETDGPPAPEDMARLLALLGESRPSPDHALDAFLHKEVALREPGASAPGPLKPTGPTNASPARPNAPARPAPSRVMRRLS